jgi:hypothetical protein
MRRRWGLGVLLGALALSLVAVPSSARLADGERTAAGPAGLPVELPVLHPETTPGAGTAGPADAVPPAARSIDGAIDDWRGTATGFGGTVVRSAGELVYTDHIFDAYGADDGRDAERLGRLQPLDEAVPETYRLEPIFTADLAGELGAPDVAALAASEHYGDAERVDVADLLEVRLGASATDLEVLVRTTSMHTGDDTAVVLLADTAPGDVRRPIPFGTGLTSDVADVAVLIAAGRGEAVDLGTGARTPVPVAADPTGYANALEAAVPATALGRPGGWGSGAPLRVGVASGALDAATGGFADLPGLASDVANVAFRVAEPVTTFFEQQQAVALLERSIDGFFVDAQPAALAAGISETWTPGPGYHDRIFTSSEAISTEGGTEGIHQHYGVYVPSAYDPRRPAPVTMWLHWRGGKAHSAATVSPRILRDQGEAFDGLVVAPRGRGTSTWYLGKGLVDVDEVWADALATFAVDEDRAYVSGHSMGGWGSYLLAILYPDRFAAAFPVAGPVTQGAWTGADFDGCDELAYDGYTPCYIATNESDPRLQHTRRLLENLRGTPLAIFQGAVDELVPTSGVTRQVERLVQLGYRHRYFVFPTYEHYSHPVVDEWLEGARYVHSFTRDPNPAHVTYVRDMPFERSVETGPSRERPTTGISFDFDRAYWMSELTPVDLLAGVARFDGVSHARPAEPALRVPEVGGPSAVGQAGPYAMTGIAWLHDPLAATAVRNAFEVVLSGASGVRLDLARMGVATDRAIRGEVTTSHDLELRLAAPWGSTPAVGVDGRAVPARLVDGVLTITVGSGTGRTITIDP